MSSVIPAYELSRVTSLRKRMQINIDDYVHPDYEGVAVHSSSIILAVNPACSAMFGYSEEELIYMNAWRLFTTESVQALMQHLLQKSQEPYVVTGIHKDKSRFKVELKGNDFEFAGEPVRVVLLRRVEK